ncbi:MAG: prepilin-type N-terminal cleavage/methylation domain-containing protein [Opitutales bacterium]
MIISSSSARQNSPVSGAYARRRAFTLIELLTVIAIIGILAAILIPTVHSVRKSANNTKTKAQFSQWATAIESFRQEYGYYPNFDRNPLSGASNSEGRVIRLETVAQRQNFIEILTGRLANGDSFPDNPGYRNHPNQKGIQFYSFSESEISREGDPFYVTDAFGNTDIVIVLDMDYNGVIRPRDLPGGNLPTVSPADTPQVSARPELPTEGIRSGILIYSAGAKAGSSGEVRSNLVKSWE